MTSKKGRSSRKRVQEEEYEYVCPPWNFSWVVPREICGSAWPETQANIDYLRSEGVGVIVSLSVERQPHSSAKKVMDCHLIPVEEFEDPSMEQITQFLDICDRARQDKKGICVHCRMGRGRTGVMLACYLIKFYSQPPSAAIRNIRLMRPGSVETYEQERAVTKFRDYLEWGHI
ncbi:hypothetical protein O3P69_014338 [Scylla paramamosain]|uniref:Dual specificity protein phosphatase 23 n=3 Tax=Scylla TaxID=6760 RepID=A0AAW0TAN6_SCYPA